MASTVPQVPFVIARILPLVLRHPACPIRPASACTGAEPWRWDAIIAKGGGAGHRRALPETAHAVDNSDVSVGLQIGCRTVNPTAKITMLRNV
jgi:hypothetical protein